jgi:hypothetical protein
MPGWPLQLLIAFSFSLDLYKEILFRKLFQQQSCCGLWIVQFDLCQMVNNSGVLATVCNCLLPNSLVSFTVIFAEPAKVFSFWAVWKSYWLEPDLADYHVSTNASIQCVSPFKVLQQGLSFVWDLIADLSDWWSATSIHLHRHGFQMQILHLHTGES